MSCRLYLETDDDVNCNDDDGDDNDDDHDDDDDHDNDGEVSDLSPGLQSACFCKLGPDSSASGVTPGHSINGDGR